MNDTGNGKGAPPRRHSERPEHTNHSTINRLAPGQKHRTVRLADLIRAAEQALAAVPPGARRILLDIELQKLTARPMSYSEIVERTVRALETAAPDVRRQLITGAIVTLAGGLDAEDVEAVAGVLARMARRSAP